MLPGDVLSTTPVVGNYLSPDDRNRELLVDYELGGIAIQDPSEGSDYQVWTLTYVSPDVIATPDTGTPVTLFSLTDLADQSTELTEVSLAFDQNMNPFVAYVQDSISWYWWYDSLAEAQVHTQMAAGVTSPRCALDDKRYALAASSDIILAYIRTGNLYFRQQRDRYGTEYLLATGVTGALVRIGMADNLRLHFGLTGSEIEVVPPPDPDPQTEIVAPYWENTGNWIDLSKLTNTTFVAMFGRTVEAAGFNSVFAVNKAALVNTSDSGNRMQIQDTLDCENAAMYITDASGNVVDDMVYNSTPNGDSVLIPTGANYYVVISSDTTNAKIKKWYVDAPVGIVGSVPWTTYFSPSLDFNRSGLTVYRFNGPVFIPVEGASIRFTVPLSGSFSMVFNASADFGFNSKTGSVNQGVLDFTTPATHTWTLLTSTLTVGLDRPGMELDLVNGETYFFNIRNDNPSASYNVIDVTCSVRVYS